MLAQGAGGTGEWRTRGRVSWALRDARARTRSRGKGETTRADALSGLAVKGRACSHKEQRGRGNGAREAGCHGP